MTAAIRQWLAAVVALSGTAAALAQSRPVVVELFTSEGCSSCPPAEAYIGQLSARSDVLPLAFHVGYWDDLGWPDRFALAQSVDRQNIYARNLHRASVYTPQLVIDGRSDSVDAAGTAISRALTERTQTVPLALSMRDGEILVEVGARRLLPQSDVVLVAYLRHALSAIGRGENAGRKLEEFNIVRDIRPLGVWKGELQSYRVAVSSLPRDATDVAVLVQPLGQAPIIGAASQALH